MSSQLGDIDTTFRAHCPRCGGTVWRHSGVDTRMCDATLHIDGHETACAYLHHMNATGNEFVEMYLANNVADQNKKERIREIVFNLVQSGEAVRFLYNGHPIQKAAKLLIEFAIAIDDSIENINDNYNKKHAS